MSKRRDSLSLLAMGELDDAVLLKAITGSSHRNDITFRLYLSGWAGEGLERKVAASLRRLHKRGIIRYEGSGPMFGWREVATP